MNHFKEVACFVAGAFLFSASMISISNGAEVSQAESLRFDSGSGTVVSLQAGDTTIRVRAFMDIVYVAFPVDTQYQCMNFYVPEVYYEGKSVGPYNKDTAPIFMPNSVGGYMPGLPSEPGMDRDGNPNSLFEALKHGYVVAAPGVRGRTLKDENGRYYGKAPSFIVDLKAAVRFLRYNDQQMPGDAEKIISNGTSAGGALSALIGATGNSLDYEPYLAELGAAPARDDIFAASCYCPITNLDHSDAAYEWLFNGQDTYHGWTQGELTEEQKDVSSRLKAIFPAYLNSLGLTAPDGIPLTLSEDGMGSFRDYVKSCVVASAQKALDSGTDLSSYSWITVRNDKVLDLDFDAYVTFATRMKTPPAFDSLTLASPETNEFGTANVDNQHFTEFSRDNSADHTMADANIIKMMNPLNYIDQPGVTTAKYWRIRHGAVDRDTSLAVPVILATTLQNKGYRVDFAVPWGVPHSGDYDLDELFAWIDSICAK